MAAGCERSEHEEMMTQDQIRHIRLFDGTGPVWRALHDLEQRLRDSKIPYVIIGGVALNAYGYPYEAAEVAIVIRGSDRERFLQQHLGSAYGSIAGSLRHVMDMQHEISVFFCIAGRLADRRGKNEIIRFPDPVDAPVRNDSRVVSLPLLIELKLARGFIRDLAAVVELIRANKLTQRFAGELDPSVRAAYHYCCEQATDEWYLGPQA